MNKEIVLGIVRHVLTGAGSYFATKGYLDDSTLQAIIGGAIALISVLWSSFEKKAK